MTGPARSGQDVGLAHDISQVAVVDDGELLVLAFAFADGTVISWQRARPWDAPPHLVVDPGQVAVEDAVRAVEIDEHRATITLRLADAAARTFGTSQEGALDLRAADPDWPAIRAATASLLRGTP